MARVSAKKRLKEVKSIPEELISLADFLLMTSVEEAYSVLRDQNRSLQERRLAAIVLECVRDGDWETTSALIDRVLLKTA
jgi:hypothetical protein